MPSQVRIIREKNSSQWDDLLRDVVQRGDYGTEYDYFGCATQARADEVRRRIRTAGAHLGVGRKVFWKECPNPGQCTSGGADCRFHVYWTLYDMEAARAYKAKQARGNR